MREGAPAGVVVDNRPGAAGAIAALAVTGPARAPLLPGVPTVAELGRPDLAFSTWFGLVAPAATPAPLRAELEALALGALAAPALRARMEEAGFRVAGRGQEAFGALIRGEDGALGRGGARDGFPRDRVAARQTA